MTVCHINVELCVPGIDGFKHQFKYGRKGLKRVAVEIALDGDLYDDSGYSQHARYVPASEAAWRSAALILWIVVHQRCDLTFISTLLKR